jgi:flagellar protein FliO/FliZ
MRKLLQRAAAAPACILSCALYCAAAHAGDAAPGPGFGAVLQMLLGLAVVLGAFFGVAWLMKRSGAVGGGGQQVLKLVSSIAVGTRERVVVVEVGGQWIVAGVAPGSVNQLASMPRGEIATVNGAPAGSAGAFAGFLKNVMDKRNAK